MADSPGFVSYSIENDRLFKEAIEKAKGVVEDLRTPFKLISRDFYRSQKAVFMQAGPPKPGGGFPDLSEAYKKAKKRKYGKVYPILWASGMLANATLGPSNAGSINFIGKDFMTIGVDDAVIPYAKYHQSSSPRTKMPMRKFLFIGPEAARFATSDQMGRLQRWLGYLNEYIAVKLGQTNLVETQSKERNK